MEPPICAVCHRDQRDEPTREFDLVKFADYEPIDRPGHPDGLLWFCEDHLGQAKTLSHLSSGEAIRQFRNTDSPPSK